MKAVARDGRLERAHQARAGRAAPRVHRPGAHRSRARRRCWPRILDEFVSAGRSTSTTRTRSSELAAQVPVRTGAGGRPGLDRDRRPRGPRARPRRGAGAGGVSGRAAPLHGAAALPARGARPRTELVRLLGAGDRRARLRTRLGAWSAGRRSPRRWARDLASAPARACRAEPVRVEANTQAEVDRVASGRASRRRTWSSRSAAARRSTSPSPPARAADLPVIVVPTQLTADGIASPVSVIRGTGGRFESRHGRLPIARRGRPRLGRRVAAGAHARGARRPAGQPQRAARLATRRGRRGRRRWTTSPRCWRRVAGDLVYGTDVHRPGRRARPTPSSCSACCADSC